MWIDVAHVFIVRVYRVLKEGAGVVDPWLVGSVVLGLIAGRITRGRFRGPVERMLMPLVLVLVFVIGVGLGSRLSGPSLGYVLAGSLSVAIVPGFVSVAVAMALAGSGLLDGGVGGGSGLLSSLITLPPLLAGSAVGYVAGVEPPDWIASYLLYMLLLLAGYSIGGLEGLGENLGGGRDGVLLAVSCLIGGALGGGLVGFFIGVDPLVGVAMGLASGWYSLVGPLLYVVDPVYGAVGLLGNMLREALHLMLYPVLARRIPLAAIALGGATTMDTGLPVVAAYAGERERVAAFIQGALLTLVLSVVLPLYVSLLLYS